MKTKNLIISVSIVLLAVAFISLAVYFSLNQSVTGTACGLGSWKVESYDKSNNQFTISISNLIHSSGCIGTYNVANKGISVFKNKSDCEYFSFSWDEEANEEGNNCFLINQNYFSDKSYKTDITCSHTIRCTQDSNGVISCKSENYQNKYNPSFDGFEIKFSNLKASADDNVICSGEITVTNSNPINYTGLIILSVFAIVLITLSVWLIYREIK